MTAISNVTNAAITLSAIDTNGTASSAEQVRVQVGNEAPKTFDMTTNAGQSAFAAYAAANNVTVSGLNTTPGGSNFVASLPPELKTMMAGITSSITNMNLTKPGVVANSDLQGRWSEFCGKMSMSGNVDINALVQAVLRDSYMETTKDLHFYAQKVKFYNELKAQIRDELTTARTDLSKVSTAANSWASETNAACTDESCEDVSASDYAIPGGYNYKAFSSTPGMVNGAPVVQDPTALADAPDGTMGGLETYIKNLEEQLNSVGDDAQLANVDLQNMLQKQQQTMQQMSNISKMLHDTAMAIIRKIG